MKIENKKKYIEPTICETVLECEDIITASLATKTSGSTSGSDFVSVGSASWSDIYSDSDK